MRTKVVLRDLTPEERTAIERLAHSRTAAARLVERAQIILAPRIASVRVRLRYSCISRA
jgi:hypothetical protein